MRSRITCKDFIRVRDCVRKWGGSWEAERTFEGNESMSHNEEQREGR